MKNLISNIIQSRIKTKTELWQESRLKHCISCSHNTKNNKKNSLLIKVVKHLSDTLNWVMRYKTKDLGQCRICFCPVLEKTKIASEVCSLTFKNQEPKWKQEDECK